MRRGLVLAALFLVVGLSCLGGLGCMGPDEPPPDDASKVPPGSRRPGAGAPAMPEGGGPATPAAPK